jgi:glycosyltransferase involved in cell wall biosynthesis
VSTKSLHIAIAGRALSHKVGGVREFSRALTRSLLALESSHRFTIYYADKSLLGKHPTAEEKYLPAAHKFLFDHHAVPRAIKRDQPDVVWFPHNVIGLGVKHPAVLTVLDLLYFADPVFPVVEYAGLDTFYMRRFIPRSIQQAKKVMMISDWTARDATRILGTSPNHMTTVHLAQGKEFCVLPPEEVQAMRTKYGLDKPFFFYAGTLSPRKNSRRMIEAFGRIKDQVPHDFVVTGGGDMLMVDHADLIEQYGLQERFRMLGLVPEQDIVALYNAAECFVFPSLYEGFGIPPLEAFACDCPVISSTASSLMEVVGDAARVVDPMDTDALAAAMVEMAGDAALRQSYIEKGRERLTRFSWEKSAYTLLGMLESAAT